MIISYEDLTTKVSRDSALTSILGVLQSLGFHTSSWHAGSVQRTVLTAVAEMYSQLTQLAASLASLGFNSLSEGSALTHFSASHYDNTRQAATYTIGPMVLTCTAAAGPYTITASDLVATDAAGHRFRNTSGGTLSSGSTLTVTFQAETAGAEYNIANSVALTLVTSLAGVTVTNPDSGSGTWITTNGTDAETDAALRRRNTTKWGTLSAATPESAYENMALEASASVARVFVDSTNPRGAGTVDIYLAAADGQVGSGVVSTVQAYVDARRPVTADPDVIDCSTVDVNPAGTVYITSSLNTASKQAEIVAAVKAYIDSVPIGGSVLLGTGYVLLSELYDAVMSITGVVDFKPTVPAADLTPAKGEIAVIGTPALTYTSV